MREEQLALLSDFVPNPREYVQTRFDGDDWTFRSADTRQLTHCFHDYPARMIPQIAGKLITMYGASARRIFDPYAGSGTTLVEGFVRGIDVFGVDLNPLARLIARSKVTALDINEVDEACAALAKYLTSHPKGASDVPDSIPGISNLSYWFKPAVVRHLSAVLRFVRGIANPDLRQFMEVALSETIREASNSRIREFKLYRYGPEQLVRWSPDVYALMTKKLARNRDGLADLLSAASAGDRRATAVVGGFNTVSGVPSDVIPNGSIDLVVTSPPYGDSHTTVAYGQYSRLSAAWLSLEEPATIDRRLMAGVIERSLPEYPCRPLNQAISRIAGESVSRAQEVATFYTQLNSSIQNVAKTIRRGGYACYVVGNRRVKGVTLPTDVAIQSFFEACRFDHVDTFTRAIPNKRMPSRNSPSNVAGRLDETMTAEYIVVCRKR
jgi:site-specific DNA-methyltransferase (cytosine-N4-specific)